MSKDRALKALNLKPTERIPHWDIPDNSLYNEQAFGFDIWKNPKKTAVEVFKHFDIDITHYIPGDIAEYNFPIVRYYDEVEYGDDKNCQKYKRKVGSSLKEYRSLADSLPRKVKGSFWGMSPTLMTRDYGFKDLKDCLSFNPLEKDNFTFEERVLFFTKYYRENQNLLGDTTLLGGWYYNTLFMWPVEIFGWENFMCAAMTDPKRFSEIMDQFFEVSKRDMLAMAEVPNMKIIFSHDDLCSEKGPMFSPDWYRKNIFPRYQELWKPIQEKGIKIIYVIDGNIGEIIQDIKSCNSDGIAFDSATDIETVFRSFSGKIIMGGGDPVVVSRGNISEIEAMVKKLCEYGMDEPGYFMQDTGLSGNIPSDNIDAYFRYSEKYGRRR